MAGSGPAVARAVLSLCYKGSDVLEGGLARAQELHGRLCGSLALGFLLWDLGNTLVAGGVGLVVVAASVWMIYALKIPKARHLRVLGLRRERAVEVGAAAEESGSGVLTGARR